MLGFCYGVMKLCIAQNCGNLVTSRGCCVLKKGCTARRWFGLVGLVWFGWLVGLVGCLAGWFGSVRFGWLVGLVWFGLLVSWFGWLVGWLVG